MINNNKKTNNFGGRSRRGVGAIIGGVILAAILLSTVFAFFMSMLQNEQARAGYQIQSEQQSRDKDLEEYSVTRFVENGVLKVNITNTGSIPMVGSHWVLYCTSANCSNPTIPVNMSSPAISRTINPGEVYKQTIGSVTSGKEYVIQVLSERGNIISTDECKVIGPSTATKQCSDSDGALTDSSPLQLDTQAFGAIFQDLAQRGSVDQEGWDNVVSSSFGNVTGYPGFHVPAGTNVVYTQHARNLDESGQALTLQRDTLLSNIDAGRKVTQPIDIVFSIDSSGSMVGNDPTNLRQSGAIAFINKLTQGVDQAAMVSWDGDDDDDCVYNYNCGAGSSTDSDFFQALTFNLNQVKNGTNNSVQVCSTPASPPVQPAQTTCGIQDIDNISATPSPQTGTNLEGGLYKAIEILNANTRVAPSNKIIVFLTDGKVEGTPLWDYQRSHESGPAAEAQAKGYKVYVIGLGTDLDIGILSDIAASTGAGLYISPTAANLDTIYTDIHAKSLLSSTIPDIIYICKENTSTDLTSAYSEISPNNKVLPAVPPDSDSTVGWQEVFFCSREPGADGDDYKPQNDFTSFHPLIMVTRGQFNNTLEEEGQTIPYQSSAVGGNDFTVFNACSKSAALPGVNCAAPTVADNSGNMRYSRTIAQMAGVNNVFIHVNTVTSPITISWLYPDGTTRLLNQTTGGLPAKDVALDANGNVQVRLPTKNSDGTNISCIPNLPGTFDSYTIRVTNQFDAEGRRDVYYMTFRVTGC